MVTTETEKTPLQQKLDEFGQQLSKVGQGVTSVENQTDSQMSRKPWNVTHSCLLSVSLSLGALFT